MSASTGVTSLAQTRNCPLGGSQLFCIQNQAQFLESQLVTVILVTMMDLLPLYGTRGVLHTVGGTEHK